MRQCAAVGPRWWDDVWLDEAIATYLSYAALAAIAGVSESLSWTGFAYTDKPEAYKADELPSRRRHPRAAQPPPR